MTKNKGEGGKGEKSLWEGSDLKRTIPVLIDKKATRRILDFRNPAHKKYIKREYGKYRKDLRKDMEGTLLPNTKVSEKALKTFDEATQKDLMNLNGR